MDATRIITGKGQGLRLRIDNGLVCATVTHCTNSTHYKFHKSTNYRDYRDFLKDASSGVHFFSDAQQLPILRMVRVDQPGRM